MTSVKLQDGINIQKSVAFLDTNKKQSKKEIKKTTTFTIVSKSIRYLGINIARGGRPVFGKL